MRRAYSSSIYNQGLTSVALEFEEARNSSSNLTTQVTNLSGWTATSNDFPVFINKRASKRVVAWQCKGVPSPRFHNNIYNVVPINHWWHTATTTFACTYIKFQIKYRSTVSSTFFYRWPARAIWAKWTVPCHQKAIPKPTIPCAVPQTVSGVIPYLFFDKK